MWGAYVTTSVFPLILIHCRPQFDLMYVFGAHEPFFHLCAILIDSTTSSHLHSRRSPRCLDLAHTELRKTAKAVSLMTQVSQQNNTASKSVARSDIVRDTMKTRTRHIGTIDSRL